MNRISLAIGCFMLGIGIGLETGNLISSGLIGGAMYIILSVIIATIEEA